MLHLGVVTRSMLCSLPAARGDERRDLGEGVASYKRLCARPVRPFWGLFKGEYGVSGHVIVGNGLGGDKKGLRYYCFCSLFPVLKKSYLIFTTPNCLFGYVEGKLPLPGSSTNKARATP